MPSFEPERNKRRDDSAKIERVGKSLDFERGIEIAEALTSVLNHKQCRRSALKVAVCGVDFLERGAQKLSSRAEVIPWLEQDVGPALNRVGVALGICPELSGYNFEWGVIKDDVNPTRPLSGQRDIEVYDIVDRNVLGDHCGNFILGSRVFWSGGAMPSEISSKLRGAAEFMGVEPRSISQSQESELLRIGDELYRNTLIRLAYRNLCYRKGGDSEQSLEVAGNSSTLSGSYFRTNINNLENDSPFFRRLRGVGKGEFELGKALLCATWWAALNTKANFEIGEAPSRIDGHSLLMACFLKELYQNADLVADRTHIFPLTAVCPVFSDVLKDSRTRESLVPLVVNFLIRNPSWMGSNLSVTLEGLKGTLEEFLIRLRRGSKGLAKALVLMILDSCATKSGNLMDRFLRETYDRVFSSDSTQRLLFQRESPNLC